MRRQFNHHYDYYDRIEEAMDAAVRNEELHAMLAHSNNLLKMTTNSLNEPMPVAPTTKVYTYLTLVIVMRYRT